MVNRRMKIKKYYIGLSCNTSAKFDSNNLLSHVVRIEATAMRLQCIAHPHPPGDHSSEGSFGRHLGLELPARQLDPASGNCTPLDFKLRRGAQSDQPPG